MGFIGDAWDSFTGFVDDTVDSFTGFVGDAIEDVSGALFDWLVPDMPDMPGIPDSPTYNKTDRIGNTIKEGVFVSRCYGKTKLGGNKLRFNEPDDTDIRIIVGHCLGQIEGITRTEVNDIEFSTLSGTHSKTEYVGSRTQGIDGRFSGSDKPSAFRGMAYTAFTFAKNDKQIGYNPNITVEMEGLVCPPFALELTTSTYKWTLSASGSDTYYCELSGGGDPGLTVTGGLGTVEQDGTKVPRDLSGFPIPADSWRSGDADTLGYETVYVHLTGGTNPNGQADNYIMYESKSVFTRNNALILYDFYRNVENYSMKEFDLNDFNSLEELCDEVPTGGTIARYRFDFNIDSNMPQNDSKKLIWGSFNGRSIISQGLIKPIWDSGQIADGSGSLTAKTVSHVFDLDNIVKGAFTWQQLERPNIVRIYFKDSATSYKTSSVEKKDEIDIAENGEILYEESDWFITDAEIARRRADYKYNRKRYADYATKFTALSGASDLEVYDLVTITHTLPGWTNKPFIITSRSEDSLGRMQFTAEAYFSGAYDDGQVGEQDNFASLLPNPFQAPVASTGISAAMTAVGTAYDFDAVRVSFTIPTTDPFYSYSEVYASNDDATYYHVGNTDGTGEFTFSALGVIYEPGETCYVKIRSVSDMEVKEDLPGAADTSVVVTSTMRLAGFYAGTNDFWGGNAAIGNVATTVVLGNLDGTPKIALGATADSLTISNMSTFPGFYADGNGDVRGGNAGGGFVASSGTFQVSGILTAGEIHIPDVDTTANSFHTSPLGNSWWGCTQSDWDDDNDNADAYILATGEAKFQNVLADGGTVGGFALSGSTMTASNLLLDAGNQEIKLGSGNDIVSLDAADATYRLAIGHATYGSAPFRVTKAGVLTATGATITGTITSNDATIGGWNVVSGYIYSLASGTPTSSPSDGLVLASGNESIIAYENTEKRAEFGYLSAGVYGLKVYADNGSDILFEFSDTQTILAGLNVTSSTISKSTTHISIDSTNAKLTINNSTFGNSGIQLDYNSGSPQFYVGDGANEFLQYTTAGGMLVSSDKSDAITLLAGGSMILEGDDAGPGMIVFDASASGEGNVRLSIDQQASTRFTIIPETDQTCLFQVSGVAQDLGGARYFKGVFIHARDDSGTPFISLRAYDNDSQSHYIYMLEDQINLYSSTPASTRVLVGGNETITPASTFEVWASTGHPILTITGQHATAYDPQINFRTDASPTVKAVIGVDATDDSLWLGAGTTLAAATAIKIDASDNVTFANSVTFSNDLLLSNGNYIGISAAERLEFYTAGYASFMGCNVGVDTDSPIHGKLQVTPTAGNAATGIALFDEGTITARSWIGSSGEWHMTRGAGASDGITIAPNGNVIIGDTSSTYKLRVLGTDSNIFNLESTDAGTGGVLQEVYFNSASPADGDKLYDISVYGNNDAAEKTEMWSCYSTCTDVSDGTEDAEYRMYGRDAGAWNFAFRFTADGTGYADASWTTFSPDIKKHPDYKDKDLVPNDYLDWALEDAKKPIKPYGGIPEEQSEKDKYGKDICKISIGVAYWAENAEKRLNEFEEKVKQLEEEIQALKIHHIELPPEIPETI